MTPTTSPGSVPVRRRALGGVEHREPSGRPGSHVDESAAAAQPLDDPVDRSRDARDLLPHGVRDGLVGLVHRSRRSPASSAGRGLRSWGRSPRSSGVPGRPRTAGYRPRCALPGVWNRVSLLHIAAEVSYSPDRSGRSGAAEASGPASKHGTGTMRTSCGPYGSGASRGGLEPRARPTLGSRHQLHRCAARLEPTSRALVGAEAPLVALFGPEHGLGGSAQAGFSEAGARDARPGYPSTTRTAPRPRPSRRCSSRPTSTCSWWTCRTSASRFYTYVWTMVDCMHAAAIAGGIPVVVLDRPNPLGGALAEGPVLDPRPPRSSAASRCGPGTG